MPESLRALVTRLLQEAAAERTSQQRIVVRLNPTDHAVLEKLLVLEDGKLTPDPAISRGGAMVELSRAGGRPAQPHRMGCAHRGADRRRADRFGAA